MPDKILISGAYGTQNLGDDKILSGLTKLCREKYDPQEVIATSVDPSSTEKVVSVDKSIPTIERDPIPWIREAQTVDLIILGGGSVICAPFARRHSLIVAIASILQIRVYVSAGVATGGWFDSFTSLQYLKNVEAITVRDEGSKRRLKSMGVPEPIDIVPDPGFVTENNQVNSDLGLPDQYVLVSVRSLPGGGRAVDVSGLAKGLDKINKEFPHQIVFFPFQRGENSDEEFALDIQRKMNTRSYIYKNKYSIPEAEKATSGADAIVAMRLHSKILAAHTRTPFTPITYAPKCEGLLDLLNISDSIEYSHIDSDKLAEYLRRNIENKYPIPQSVEMIETLEQDCRKILEKCDEQRRGSSFASILFLFAILPVIVLKQIIGTD